MSRRGRLVAGIVCATVLSGCGTVPSPPESPQSSLSPQTAPTTSTGSPSGASAPPAKPAKRPGKPTRTSVTVVMNGDLLWHNTLWYGAREDAHRRGRAGFDFAPLLAGLKPVISSADLAICHEEVPLARPGGPYRNYPRFSAPPQVARAIKSTGYDVCTTASNHSLDRGFGGLKRTLDDLDHVGVKHAGTARTRAEARRPTIVTTRSGVKIAVVSATFGLNGIPVPPGKSWSVNRLEPGAMVRQARRARRAGADLVIAAGHVGTEYSSRENAQQRHLAHRLARSGAFDLIYMHHPHVVQPWTMINHTWVLYGLGNTVAQHATRVPRGYEGVTGRFTFSRLGQRGRFRVSRAEYIPTLVTRYRPGRPARVYRVSTALRHAGGSFRKRLIIAQRRTSATVTRKGPEGLHRG